MRSASLILAAVLVMGCASSVGADDEWFLWRATVMSGKQTLWVKYPLITMRQRTREACLFQLHADLSETLRRSVPPAPRVEGVEAMRQEPNVWVYRLLGPKRTVVREIRFHCVTGNIDPRQNK